MAALVVCLASYAHAAEATRVGLPAPGEASRTIDRVASAIEASRPSMPILVRIATPDAWPLAAGVLVHLEKAGFATVVEDDWVFTFGEQHRRRGGEPTTVVVEEGRASVLGR